MKQTEETLNPSPSRSVLVWFILITLGGITFYARYNFVPALETHSTLLKNCPETIYSYLNYECGDFDIQSNPVIAMEITGVCPDHGFVALEAFPILAKGAALNTIDLELAINTFAVTENRQILNILQEEKNKILHFSPSSGDKPEYTPQTLSQVPHISHENYIVVIKILNNYDIQRAKVEDIKLGFITFNPTFENYLFYFKSFLFGVAVISWLIYTIKASSIPSEFVTSEQTCVKYAGFFLALFLQPFVGVSTFSQSLSYSLIFIGITAFLTTFIVSLWLYTIERLASDTYSVSSTAGSMITSFAVGHFILIMVTFGFLALDQSTTPLIEFQTDDYLAVTLCKYYVYIVLGVGALWSVIRVCQILPQIKNMDWRDSNAFTFSFYYILCYGFFLITGSLQVLAIKSERLVLLLGITTLFVVIMQAIVAPSGLESEEAQQKKKYDNPAVKGAYDDLDMSDMSGRESKDQVGLRGQDVLQKRANAHEEDEDEEDIEA